MVIFTADRKFQAVNSLENICRNFVLIHFTSITRAMHQDWGPGLKVDMWLWLQQHLLHALPQYMVKKTHVSHVVCTCQMCYNCVCVNCIVTDREQGRRYRVLSAARIKNCVDTGHTGKTSLTQHEAAALSVLSLSSTEVRFISKLHTSVWPALIFRPLIVHYVIVQQTTMTITETEWTQGRFWCIYFPISLTWS